MRKNVLGACSLVIVGALALTVIPASSLATQDAGATEPLNKTENVQTLVVSEAVELPPLERGTYAATTPEEIAAKKAAEEAEKAAAKAQAASVSSAPASAPSYSGGGSPAEWMAAAGIAESDWGYVDYIVSKESGWNPNAVNKSSGASGLVQALPCGKVPGSCFNPVDNLKWADGYAKGRYGSWAGAYNFWISNHWW